MRVSIYHRQYSSKPHLVRRRRASFHPAVYNPLGLWRTCCCRNAQLGLIHMMTKGPFWVTMPWSHTPAHVIPSTVGWCAVQLSSLESHFLDGHLSGYYRNKYVGWLPRTQQVSAFIHPRNNMWTIDIGRRRGWTVTVGTHRQLNSIIRLIDSIPEIGTIIPFPCFMLHVLIVVGSRMQLKGQSFFQQRIIIVISALIKGLKSELSRAILDGKKEISSSNQTVKMNCSP